MTLNEFNLLSEDQQSTIILSEGVFIDIRFERGFRILLYHIYSFYAEVYYNPADNEIQTANEFFIHRPSGALSEPYKSQRVD